MPIATAFDRIIDVFSSDGIDVSAAFDTFNRLRPPNRHDCGGFRMQQPMRFMRPTSRDRSVVGVAEGYFKMGLPAIMCCLSLDFCLLWCQKVGVTRSK